LREEPYIVKILREEENSRLTSNMHSIFKHQEVIKEEPKDIENTELDFPEEYNTFLDDSEGKNNENTSNDISDLLFESTTNMMIYLDSTGKVLKVNKATLNFLGFTKEELEGRPFWKIPGAFKKKDIPKYLKIIENVFQGKKVEGFKGELLDKSGDKHILNFSFYPRKQNNKVTQILLVGEDITKFEKTEKQLLETEETYKNLIENSPDSIGIIDNKGIFTHWNTAAEKIYGFSKEEIVGKHFTKTKLLNKKDIPKFIKLFLSISSGKETKPFETEIVHKDGKRVAAEIYYSVIKHNGKKMGIQATSRDITERKTIEKDLNESNERYKSIFERSRDWVYIHDFKGNFLDANQASLDGLGYTKEDIKKTNFTTILPKSELLRALKDTIFLKKRGYDVTPKVYSVKRKDGTEIFVETLSTVLYKNGKPYAVQGMARDITDRKNYEEELKNNEKKLRTVLETVKEGITFSDKTGKFEIFNLEMERLTGYTYEEANKCSDFSKLIYPTDESREKALEALTKLTKPGSIHEAETRIITKDGKTRDMLVSTVIVPYNGKEMFLSAYRDITERLKKETELLKFSRAMQQSQTSVIITDDKGTIQYINPKFEEVSGYRKAEIIGKNTNILKSGKNPKETYETLWKTISLGDTWKGELLNKKKNGEFYWENVIITPIKNPEGKITNFVASKEDITQRKKMVEDLKIKDYAISSSINAIAITNSVGNVTYVNPAFLKMWGYIDDKDVVGKPLIKFWQMKGNYMKVMDAMVNQGGWVGELTAEKADGTSFPVQLSANLVKDERKEIKYMMASFVDITKQKQAEEELLKNQKRIEEQNTKLKKLDELKSTFLNVTSHELRTPMASIKGYVQMVMKQTLGQTSDEQNKALNVVLRNVDRLDHLIQDILDISRLESGTMKFIPEDTNIAEIINEIAETMQSSANAKQIKIKTEINGKIPNLTVDQDRIKQVIINFINNAIKFSEPNTEITIRTCKQEKDILIEVQDFGRGIPSDKLTKVFDTFYQVDSGMDRKFGGAGLGLSISRGIVLAHGGKIWAESQEKKGSTFKFTLPLEPVKNLEDNFRNVDVFRLKEDEIKEEYEKYKNRMKI